MKYFVEPWDHQYDAFNRGIVDNNLFLAWEMGTGKTATTINLIRQRIFAYPHLNLNVLILAPKVVLFNWYKEFGVHSDIPSGQVTVLTGSSKQKIKNFKEFNGMVCSKVVITNYESLDNEELKDLLTMWKPDILVCDESHKLKSHKAKRSKAVYKIAIHSKYNYLLSGTPILNTPVDIFMQLKILDANKPGGSPFGIKYTDFLYKWFEDKNAHMRNRLNYFPKWRLRTNMYKKFHDRVKLRTFRVRKEECLDLPPLVKKRISVELSTEQKRAYKEMKNEFITFVDEQLTPRVGVDDEKSAAVATLAITKALRLQQIVSGFIRLDNGSDHVFAKNQRLDVLRELVEEISPANKIIIWANFRNNIRAIEGMLDKIGVKYETLYGETRDKQGAIDRFVRDGSVRVFVANQKAAGTGVDGLQLAPYAIYYSRSYSLEDDFQSESRNHRGGSEQHDKVTRIDLVAGNTIDELILEALEKKQSIADLILDWVNKL